MPSDNEPPLPLQEVLDLVKLPPAGQARRYMSTRSAYLPGSDFTGDKGALIVSVHKAAFGGHVYGQAVLAAARAWREIENEKGATPGERLNIHTIHGYFTRPGNPTRSFIYTVTPLTTSRTFSTLSVTAHQPSQPSTNPLGDHFPLTDASLPLSPPCFTALISLKLPEPHSHGVSIQEPPPQQRFASILSSRPPEAWPPSPPVDIEAIVELAGADQQGKFPVATMRKVDMMGYNSGKPVHERRELVLYKLLKPLPFDGAGGWDISAHIAAHTFVADRNGLLMTGNHAGFGHAPMRAASLSYSFVVHVNGEEAVMREDDGDGWWVQEASFPRVAAGRGVIESKVWSPGGVHVATEYQDGLVQGAGVLGGKL